MKAIEQIKRAIKVSGSGPARANWVWLWAVVLALSAMGRFPEMNYMANKDIAVSQGMDISPEEWTRFNSRTPKIVVIIVLEILAALALCSWWHSRSKLLRRRSVPLQLFGFLLFGLGTFEVLNSLSFSLYSLSLGLGSWGVLHEISRPSGVLGAALIAVAYFLVFRVGTANGPEEAGGGPSPPRKKIKL